MRKAIILMRLGKGRNRNGDMEEMKVKVIIILEGAFSISKSSKSPPKMIDRRQEPRGADVKSSICHLLVFLFLIARLSSSVKRYFAQKKGFLQFYTHSSTLRQKIKIFTLFKISWRQQFFLSHRT
jgi:hypothetical protein